MNATYSHVGLHCPPALGIWWTKAAKENQPFLWYLCIYFGYGPLTVTVGHEGLVRDPLLKCNVILVVTGILWGGHSQYVLANSWWLFNCSMWLYPSGHLKLQTEFPNTMVTIPPKVVLGSSLHGGCWPQIHRIHRGRKGPKKSDTHKQEDGCI